MGISANLVVRNEAERLRALLPILRSQVDEIVLVDQESTDETVDVAKEFCDVILHDVATGFADTSRPLAMSSSKEDWIICLDADEFITTRLAADFNKIFKWPAIAGVFMSECLIRVDYLSEINKKEIMDVGYRITRQHVSIKKYRLFLNNEDCVRWPSSIHQEILPPSHVAVLFLDYNGIVEVKTHREQELDMIRYKSVLENFYNKDLYL